MMETNRYDIFNLIHKGLRTMLYDTANCIQQTDFNNRAQVEALLPKLKSTLKYLDQHAEHEDQYILTEIKKHDPQLVERLEEEHDIDHELTSKLYALIERLNEATPNEELLSVGKHIYYHFNEFIAFNLYHMNIEEQQLNQVLWSNYTDMEIIGMEQRILADIPPPILMDESKWMLRGANDRDITGWYGGIKANAPSPVYDAFVQILKDELPNCRQNNVLGRLEAI